MSDTLDPRTDAEKALQEAKETLTDLDAHLIECGPLHTAEDAYDTSYRGRVLDALISIDIVLDNLTQPQAGEPVAWLTEGYGYKRVFLDKEAADKLARGGDGNVQPLYTSPQPANPAQVTEAPVGEWAIDRSTDSPILTYEKCSVIQDEQAFYVLSLIRAAIGAGGQAVAESLWVPAKPEHKKIGWTYDFDQTERLSRAAEKATGYDATLEVIEFVMSEADRRHKSTLSQPHPADERVVEALRKIEYSLTKDSLCEAEKIDDAIYMVRRALSAAPATADGWKLVPVEPTRDHLERLATLWGYTLEETADNYGAFLDALPADPTATGGR
jgi:hypothetical protein